MQYQEAENLYLTAADGTRYAYRDFGQKTGTPIILFNHLSANLDNWDPRLLDRLGQRFRLIAFDNKGVGGSSGHVPRTIQEMAAAALDFIEALGFSKVHILAFSLGGMVAQEVLLARPDLVEKLILAGTGGRGGLGIDKVSSVTFSDMSKALLHRVDPKRYLFFNHDEKGEKEAAAFLAAINGRQKNRDKSINLTGFFNQLAAIKTWGEDSKMDLTAFGLPVLVANGDNDRIVPTINSYDLAERFPNSQLIIYPAAGHSGIFQYYEDFSQKVITFLED